MKRGYVSCFLMFCMIVVMGVSAVRIVSYANLTPIDHTTGSVQVEYPEDREYIVAYQDTALLNFSFGLDSMAEGERISVEFPLNHGLQYSRESFFLGENYKIEPEENGFSITALREVSGRGIEVSLPVRYITAAHGLEIKEYAVQIGTEVVSFELKVKEWKDFVDASEVIKKVCLGKSDQDTICWVIYFNYNQMELISRSASPFIFKDLVGDGLRLKENSIAFYHVSDPIRQDGSRNTAHDSGSGSYNWEVSATLQNSADNTGWYWETSDFQGFPWFYNTGNDAADAAYYIYYETEVTDQSLGRYKNTAYLKTLIENGSCGLGVDVSSESYYRDLRSGTGSAEDGSLIFRKAASHDISIGLQGAVFELYDSRGDLIGSAVTDSDGVGKILNLPYGEHTLIETLAPDGYLSDGSVHRVVISDEAIVDYGDIVNDISGSAKLLKKDDRTGEPLPGAVFELRRENGELLQEGLVTDSSGTIFIGDLRPGRYRFAEVSAPAGYELDALGGDFEILPGKSETVTVVKMNGKKGLVDEGEAVERPGVTNKKRDKKVDAAARTTETSAELTQEEALVLEPNAVPLESALQENYDSGILDSVPKTGDYPSVRGIAACLSQIIGALAVTVLARKKIKIK